MKNYSNSKIPRLYEIMEERGIKAKDITAATGISSGNIADWKSGRSVPKAHSLYVIAEFLGVTTDYLLGNDDSKTVKEEVTQDKKEEMFIALFNQLTEEQQNELTTYMRTLHNHNRMKAMIGRRKARNKAARAAYKARRAKPNTDLQLVK